MCPFDLSSSVTQPKSLGLGLPLIQELRLWRISNAVLNGNTLAFKEELRKYSRDEHEQARFIGYLDCGAESETGLKSD